MATEVMFAREGASARRMRAGMGLGPVGVVSLPVGLEIKGPSESSRAIGALVLLLWVAGHQLNFIIVHAWHVRLRGGGRR